MIFLQQKRKNKVWIVCLLLPVLISGVFMSITYKSLQPVAAEPETTITDSKVDATLNHTVDAQAPCITRPCLSSEVPATNLSPLRAVDKHNAEPEVESMAKQEEVFGAGQPPVITPFWLVIPESNGTELTLVAINTPELAIDLRVNIAGVEATSGGPSNYEHSYAPVYTETLGGYFGKAAGLTEESDFVGGVNIEDVDDNNLNEIDVKRFFIEPPILSPINIFSDDGVFKMTLINSDTLSSEVYLAFAENDFPPVAAPEGSYFVTKSYSVRKSTNNVFFGCANVITNGL